MKGGSRVVAMDALIPLGGLVVIGFLGYAIVTAARRQNRTKSQVFRSFAERLGMEYLVSDDGTARDFAADLDGIGRFSSPSLGAAIPRDVVRGTWEGIGVTGFRHSTRLWEGNSREWYVIGVTASDAVAERSSVEFLEEGATADSPYLSAGVVAEYPASRYRLVVRAPTRDAAGVLTDEEVLVTLAKRAEGLAFRPEIQIGDRRIATYPAGRNVVIDDPGQLIQLLEFALQTKAAVEA